MSNFDDSIKLKSFDLADAAIKQVLTITIAAIGGTIVLFDNKDQAGINFGEVGSTIFCALTLFSLSFIFGLLAINNLAGVLANPPEEGPSVYKGSIRFFWSGQLFLVALGVGALLFAMF